MEDESNQDFEDEDSGEESEEKIKTRIDNNPDSRLKKIAETGKKNPWMISTAILGIAVIVLLIMTFRGGITGGVIGVGSAVSGEDAGQKIVKYLNGRTGGGVEYVSNEDLGSNLYAINVKYQEQDIPVFVTKDGEYFVQGAIPMDKTAAVQDASQQAQQPQEVVKSDKPKVELFIWSYCPYGVQAQGLLANVASLLGKDADFEGVLYYDGHGEFETEQNKIQACIQEVAKDKYWEYAAGFVEDIYPKCGSSRDVQCNEEESIKLMKSLGIDDSKVMSCVDSKGEDLIAEHSARASGYGVTGSPSLIINGVKVNTARTAEAFKSAVCGAFNDAPEECGEVLDSSSAAAAGNC